MATFIQMPPKKVLTWLCAEYFALINSNSNPFCFFISSLFFFLFFLNFPFRHLNAALTAGINKFLKRPQFNSLTIYVIFFGVGLVPVDIQENPAKSELDSVFRLMQDCSFSVHL